MYCYMDLGIIHVFITMEHSLFVVLYQSSIFTALRANHAGTTSLLESAIV